jgi:glucokinase
MPTRRTIGVDIGGRRLLAGAVDSGLDVHHRTQRAVAGLEQSALLDAAVDAVDETRNAAGAEIAAVGFGIPSVGDKGSDGAGVEAEPPLAELTVADVMAERLGLPTFVDTGANVVALAEHRAGAARGAREAVVLTIGAGIRGGLILGGELQHGPDGSGLGGGASGSELADAVAQAAAEHPESGLARALREGREPAGTLVTELAHDGDRGAIGALAILGRRLGVAIARLVDAYNPQVVVVGGGITAAGELLLGPARAELAARGRHAAGDQVPMVAARFGVDAGLIGAAALAFDGLERRRGKAA